MNLVFPVNYRAGRGKQTNNNARMLEICQFSRHESRIIGAVWSASAPSLPVDIHKVWEYCAD